MASPLAVLRQPRNSVPLPRAIPGSGSRASAYRFFLIIGALGALIVWGLASLWGRDPALLFWITLGYFSYEVGLNVLLVAAAWFGIRSRRHLGADRARRAATSPLETPGLSLLIAAHNEHACIFATLESVFAQGGPAPQVIIASDGSSDGMNEQLIARFSLRRTLPPRCPPPGPSAGATVPGPG